MADIMIRARVITHLGLVSHLPHLRVEVEEGNVKLSGDLASIEELQQALIAVLGVAEVRRVIARVKVTEAKK